MHSAATVSAASPSPLAQGILTDKYLAGTIPQDSRAAKAQSFLKPGDVTAERLQRVSELQRMAETRGQTLAQMALAWLLRHPQMSSVLIGASRTAQIDDAVQVLQRLDFSAEELSRIDAIAPPPATRTS